MSDREPASRKATMTEEASRPRGLFRSLRSKLILAFCILSALVSVALAVSTYTILDRNLFQQLRSRVRGLTDLGSLTLDREALARLASRAAEGLSEEEVADAESSRDFRLVSDSLNRIRGVEPQLVRFIYTFVPTGDPNKALFLVDGDVLLLGSTRPNGEKIEEDGISHFASEFDISEFPVARRAIAEKRNLVENEYTFDEDFKVNSVTGYAPVLARDGRTLLAVLGLDMVDTDVRASLNRTTVISLIIAAAALALAIGTSIGIGTTFTRGIISLDRVMQRFSETNLDIRAQVRSRDEVGRLGMSFNQMAGLIQRYIAAYGRFVPHDFLRFLGKKSITEVKLGDQVLREMTILFSDIRSFTSLSETMSPQENFNFLNSYLSRVGPEIRANNGFIDKYIGDAVMGLFPGEAADASGRGSPCRSSSWSTTPCVRAGATSRSPVGVAVHTGKLMLGTIGERLRMDGTVIADAVNLASRLEGLSRLYGETILITGPTLSQLAGRRDFQTRFIDRVRVRGRKEAVLIYEVYDWEAPERVELRQSLKADWSQAMNLYYGREFLPASACCAPSGEGPPGPGRGAVHAALRRAGQARGPEGLGRRRGHRSEVTDELERCASVSARGAVLLGRALACDAHAPRPLRLVSHIHADHLHGLATSLQECRLVLAAPLTRDLLAVLKGRRKARLIHPLACGESFEWQGERLELATAGHIAGSAQALLTTADGVRIAYTGDIKSPPAPVLRADVLVTEATYGDPTYVRVFRDRVEECFLELVRERLGQGPVRLVGYHGKLQEAAGILHRGGIDAPLLAPDRIFALLEVCRAHGLPLGPVFKQGTEEAEQAGRGLHIRLQHTAVPGSADNRIVLSGWQFDEPCRRVAASTFRVALSDHSDFEQLLAYVAASGARLVIADGFRAQAAGVFAAEVQRRLGVKAIALP